ncbi:MAG: sterol desaturase family protein [Deltaproteobacteria bacterium]|nr:sterol desaturase family protein [Deltaproteobacteria bacterium]
MTTTALLLGLLLPGAAFAAGLILWTFLEYVLHRFAFHERMLGQRVAREHLEHHAKVDHFAPLSHKVALAVPVLGAIFGLAWLVTTAPIAAGLALGVVTGWLSYEVLHRRIHVAAPLNAYGRWARRHHLSHHFGNAKLNHGVSSPIWDHVFGTHAPRATVLVPRRHATKFPWLLDDASRAPKELALQPSFTDNYRLVG